MISFTWLPLLGGGRVVVYYYYYYCFYVIKLFSDLPHSVLWYVLYCDNIVIMLYCAGSSFRTRATWAATGPILQVICAPPCLPLPTPPRCPLWWIGVACLRWTTSPPASKTPPCCPSMVTWARVSRKLLSCINDTSLAWGGRSCGACCNTVLGRWNTRRGSPYQPFDSGFGLDFRGQCSVTATIPWWDRYLISRRTILSSLSDGGQWIDYRCRFG